MPEPEIWRALPRFVIGSAILCGLSLLTGLILLLSCKAKLMRRAWTWLVIAILIPIIAAIAVPSFFL
ncbi:hypothetical protein JXA32_09415 [Candidatus Sumerlaeota bacterium]|nr:hypothetical protein [Candidatus Sumerlaeota bacterium]